MQFSIQPIECIPGVWANSDMIERSTPMLENHTIGQLSLLKKALKKKSLNTFIEQSEIALINRTLVIARRKFMDDKATITIVL